MPLEVVGMIGTRPGSEQSGPGVSIVGGHIDPEFLTAISRAHEEGGFDTVLVGYGSTGPDGFAVAAYAAERTERLRFLIAHRPGFVAPTLAARKAATLDQLTDGRIALHFITGGSDAEQQCDGDWLDHDGRYRRTGEYLDVVTRIWTEPQPIDFDGEFYRIRGGYSEVRPRQQPRIPVYFGGMSEAALDVGARYADVYMFWGEPLASIAQQIAQVRAAAARYGRSPRFSVSLRPVLGATEAAAWERAHAILGRIRDVRGEAALGGASVRPQSAGSRRLLEFAAQQDVYDTRLWLPIATATGAGGNTTCLVGTPEQVAEALLAYWELGVTTLLIRGFDPLEDAIEYGRDLIPLLRAEVARRERLAGAV